MKVRWWFRPLTAIGRLARAAERIAAAQERLADAAEGIEPPARVLPPTTEPVTRYPEGDNDFFARVEAVTERLRTHYGHDPTAEEVQKELDQENYSPADLSDQTREKLGL